MSLRTEVAAMLAGHQTTEAVVQTSEPAVKRRAETPKPHRSATKKRATMPAKDLAPETMDPSPE